jgi:predicted DNA-binding transcriptional regulator AlpA
MEDTQQPTQDECWTLTVPVAGKRLGLSRGASYDAAKRGDFPGLIKIGRRLLVSKAALERALDNGWLPPKD